MPRATASSRNYNCLTREQKQFYNNLPLNQRKYIDYRVSGYSKTASYRMAGYRGDKCGQAAYLLETRNEGLRNIIKTIEDVKYAALIVEPESDINKTIDALAAQQGAEETIKAVEGADSETARRIQFYRDIMNGKIKTKRKTKRYNSKNELLETKEEEVSDVETKIKARKELDKILGVNAVLELDTLKMGDITINIVDASKKEELEDVRNEVEIASKDEVKIEDVGKEQVVEERGEKPTESNDMRLSKSDMFFNALKDNE